MSPNLGSLSKAVNFCKELHIAFTSDNTRSVQKNYSSNHSRLAMGDKTTEEFRVSHRRTFLDWNFEIISGPEMFLHLFQVSINAQVHSMSHPQRENTTNYSRKSDENMQVHIAKSWNHSGSTSQAVKWNVHLFTSLFDKEFRDKCSAASQIHKIPGGCGK